MFHIIATVITPSGATGYVDVYGHDIEECQGILNLWAHNHPSFKVDDWDIAQ